MANQGKVELKLYMAGQTSKSVTASQNITRYCKENLEDNFSIEVIDLLQNPQLAIGDQIFVIPTLVRNMPVPIRKISGDLSNEDEVFKILGITIT